tara:strand:+ start:380 stop:607 length:228 start_codon:yes stop_codon:yes gene_type:complete
MTVSNDSSSNKKEESSYDLYWQSYFEDETLPLDEIKKRACMESKYGNKQKQQAAKRLEYNKEKQKKSSIDFIYDR